MKTLLLIRHAKSSWDIASQNDFDRPLNSRGQHDAPEMAQRLILKKINIDCFITSTANRAFSTAQFFLSAYQQAGFLQAAIAPLPSLYQAPPSTFYESLANQPKHYTTIAMFAHNPGITDFVNQLTETKIDNMPTCGIFGIRVAIDDWADFKEAKKEFLFFEYPKKVSF